MDVRAPIEFQAGAFPGSVNIPLLDDAQRHVIGTAYAKQGKQAAIDLGLQLATADIREQRMADWQRFTDAHSDAVLYCFRGGLRSRTAQAWLREKGVEIPLIEGGYKAMRRFLLEQLERLCADGKIVVLSGATGVGKTELIKQLNNAIDLEGRANHRGSAFGKSFSEQPTQINWENQITIDWLKCEAAGHRTLILEDESKLIGRIGLPDCLRNAMVKAPRVLLKAGLSERVARLRSDYLLRNLAHFEATEKDPWTALGLNIQENLTRIRKRLGGARYQELSALIPVAVSELRDQNSTAGFDSFIGNLLDNYYDKFYAYQMQKHADRIICEGATEELKSWLLNNQDWFEGSTEKLLQVGS